jgi:hypothetical protein
MKPVEYSVESKAIVAGYDGLPNESKAAAFWSADEVASVRKEIKDHYIQEQHQTCCYCNVVIPTNNNAVWDAEHVISRSRAPKFMFEPLNLAISCKDCNLAKGEQEVRVNSARVTFPVNTRDYKIVHPHFDSYADHIRWYGMVCKPETHKGKATIEMCNLLRFSLSKLNANAMPHNPEVDRLIGQLMSAHDSVGRLAALAGLEVYLRRTAQK